MFYSPPKTYRSSFPSRGIGPFLMEERFTFIPNSLKGRNQDYLKDVHRTLRPDYNADVGLGQHN